MCLPTTLPIAKATVDINDPSNNNVSKKPHSNKRRLSFAPKISKVIGTVLPLCEFTDAEKAACWWSTEEQAWNRAASRSEATIMRKSGSAFITLLDDAYETALDLSQSFREKDLQQALNDPTCYTTRLEAWTLIALGRRGLEKSISLLHRYERYSRASEARTMVVDTGHAGIRDEEIAEVYAELSRSALVYARMMGASDYHAAYWQC